METMRKSCEFCDEVVDDNGEDNYADHLRSVHKINVNHPDKPVKCMFCFVMLKDIDMFGHVFLHHRVTGLMLEDNDRPVPCAETGVQTDTDHDDGDTPLMIADDEPAAAVTVGTQTDNENKPDTETRAVQTYQDIDTDTSETDDLIVDVHTEEAVLNAGSNEILNYNENTDADLVEVADTEEGDSLLNKDDTLITLLTDDDDSDFEIDCKCLKCDYCNSAPTSKTLFNSYEDGDLEAEDEYTTVKSTIKTSPKSNPVQRTEPKKKVTFQDLTNIYPVRKFRWLERLKKNREPMILGANTRLKYLKYWGVTNKPDDDEEIEIVKLQGRRTRSAKIKSVCDTQEEEESAKNLGFYWICSYPGCSYKNRKLILVRKHASKHVDNK